MPRIPRRYQWASEACFHLMDRGHNREAIFADDEDRHAFLGLLGRYQSRFRLRLYHYCLMTNHFHVLVQREDPAQVSPLMAGLLRAYVHHCHRRHGFVGHRWQGRFQSPAVPCSEYLLSCGRSIERNPLEAGMVALPWAYAWSSAAAYALGRPDALLAENAESLGLASSPGQRQESWQRFLLADDGREAMVRRGDWAIGDEGFRQRVLLEHGRPTPRRRGRPPKPASATSPR